MTVSEAPNGAMRSSGGATSGPIDGLDRVVHGVLLALAGWCVWRPVETSSSTAVWIVSVVLGLSVWAWRRTPAVSNPWLATASISGLLLVSGLAGWDPESAILEIALLLAVVSLIWLASRSAPPDHWPALLALVISALTAWGVWQVAGGMERAAAEIPHLPEGMQMAVAERLASGRAFASQLLPSHLAVLLATALPLLLARLRLRWSAAPWAVGVVLCVVGLVLTRSPVGAALAVGACAVLSIGRRKRVLLWTVLLLVVVVVIVVSSRSDVVQLEPVKLRLDNWRTAIWVWSQAPAAGAGFGGLAQAAQAVPFGVGNRPRHAHSLPFEWLAELGPLGFLACVLAGCALWRLLRDLWNDRPELSAALAVVPAHNLVDFSCYSTGVVLAWAVLAGWGVALRARKTDFDSAPARFRVAFVTATAVIFAATMLHVTSSAVEEAAVSREKPTDRFDGAVTARHLAPWRTDPLGPIAAAALESGDPVRLSAAIAELDRGRWLRPRSAALAGLRARLTIATGEVPTAVAEAWTATVEQPSNDILAERLEALLDRLAPGAEDDGG